MTSRFSSSRVPVLSGLLLLAAAWVASAAVPLSITRLSVGPRTFTNPTGAEGNGASVGAIGLGGNGRYVAFASGSSNLVTSDTNAKVDIFVRDRTTGGVERVSTSASSFFQYRLQANGDSGQPSISDDGRFVAFETDATNLINFADFNRARDVYVRDRRGETIAVSVDAGGGVGNGNSSNPAISRNGGFVAFQSVASSLVGGDTNARSDVFLQGLTIPNTGSGPRSIRVTGISRISIATDGTQGDGDSANPSISANGRYVAFQSTATNLVSGDANGRSDIFVRDTTTGITVLVSKNDADTIADGNSTLPSISADGRFVAYVSRATNLVSDDANSSADVFLHDRDADGNGVLDEAGGTTVVCVSRASDGSEGDDDSGLGLPSQGPLGGRPSVSDDGRFVAFYSEATNFAPLDANNFGDIFLHDTAAASTDRMSVSVGGAEGNLDSSNAALSGNGLFLAFNSNSDTLAPNDLNLVADVFGVEIDLGLAGNSSPAADAGADQQVSELQQVTLDGSGSSDPEDGANLIYSWAQTDGPAVVLAGGATVAPKFTAPLVFSAATLTFRLTVTDQQGASSTDTVLVDVQEAPSGAVAGSVTDKFGNAISGASVEVIRNDGASATPVATDEFGGFLLEDVRVGTNTLVVRASGFEPFSTEFDVASGELALIDVVLDVRTAILTGRVLRADGNGVPDATVELLDRTGVVLGFATTSKQGEYLIDNILAADAAIATNVRITGPTLITFLAGDLVLKAGGINLRDFQYGNLQVTISGADAHARRLLDGTTVRLEIGGQVLAANVATRRTLTLKFPNVPATRIQVRAINPNLTGALVEVVIEPTARFKKVTLKLRTRGVF